MREMKKMRDPGRNNKITEREFKSQIQNEKFSIFRSLFDIREKPTIKITVKFA
jgi:hypothetical protein